MDRRGLLGATAAVVTGMLVGRPALASLSRAVRVEELVGRSRHVVLGEPLDAYSVWERIGGRKHIVTYTRVRTHDVLTGADPKDEELLVRTLGGRVGDLGQLVHGEAQLLMGDRNVLFLMPSSDALAVTAMAQGHYPLARDVSGLERLKRSPVLAELVDETGSAVKLLNGQSVSEARSLVRRVVRK